MAQIVEPPHRQKEDEDASSDKNDGSDPKSTPPDVRTPRQQTKRGPSPGNPSPSPKRAKNAGKSTSSQLSEAPEETEAAACGTVSVRAPPEEKRLVISQMVMTNFKSYYGRQVVGPFNDHFTAIIGPNGSGKSNVIDALLFVFGWHSKALRQANMAGLIHKSKGYQVQECNVEIHFALTRENGDRTTTRIPGSEIVVSRHIKVTPEKSGTHPTWYTINGVRKTVKQVEELLEGYGIDLTHRRFLILQGEVENIAMMQPKGDGDKPGLLEYLEDIIGTSKYVKSLDELLVASDTLREQCLEAQSYVKASDESLRSLDESRTMCFQAFQLQNQISVANFTLESKRLVDLERKQEIVEDQLKENEGILTTLTTTQSEADKKIAGLESESNDFTKQSKTAKSTLEASRVELKKTTTSLTRATTSVDHSKTKLIKLEKDKTTAESNIERTSTWLKNFDRDMAELEEKLETTKTTLEADEAELAQQRNKLAESIKPLTAKIERKQAEVEPWRTEIQTKKHDIKVLEDAINEAKQGVISSEESHTEVKTRLQIRAETGKTQKKTLSEGEKKLEKNIQDLENLKEKFLGLEAKLNGLQDAARESRAAYTHASESQSSAKSQGRVAEALDKFAVDNKIKGYYGLLGNLGAIDDKYDVAISTACPRLDQFVTDDLATAQRCIKFLRERNIGRATFIALEKLKPYRQPNPSLSKPVPLLISLIKPKDKKFMSAFYFATGDTAVAKDIHEARDVAFKSSPRVKTVTLKGEVIAVSGAMSGGGSPSRGKMSNAIVDGMSASEMASLKEKMQQDELKLNTFKSDYERTSSTIEGLENEIPRLSRDVEVLKVALDDTRTLVADLKASKEEAKKYVEAAKEHEASVVQENTPKISACEGEIQKLKSKSEALEKEIAQIREQILDKGGVELRILDAKVADQRSWIKQLTLQQTDKQSDKMSQSKKLEKYKEELADAESGLESLRVDIEKTEAQLGTLRQREKELEETVRNLETQLNEYDNRLDRLKDEIAEIKDEMSESQRERQRLEKAVSDLKASSNDLAKSVETTQTFISKLSIVDLEPYIDLRARHRDPKLRTPEYHFNELSSHELVELTHDAIEELKTQVSSTQARLDGLDYSVECIPEYRRVFEEWKKRREDLDIKHKDFERVKDDHARITEMRKAQFLEGLHAIKKYLKVMYRLITTDGNADLDLYDTTDPFEGVVFEVMPPGKNWKKIQNLSGGEKTLSSLALVFALHKYRPTPLYVMDEIDAALDFRNVSIIANYIQEQTKQGQFIVISLRNNMFEMASRLVGIYKFNDHTRSAVYDPPPPDQNLI